MKYFKKVIFSIAFVPRRMLTSILRYCTRSFTIDLLACHDTRFMRYRCVNCVLAASPLPSSLRSPRLPRRCPQFSGGIVGIYAKTRGICTPSKSWLPYRKRSEVFNRDINGSRWSIAFPRTVAYAGVAMADRRPAETHKLIRDQQHRAA